MVMTTRGIAVFCAALLVAQRPYGYAQPAQSASTQPDASQKPLTPGQLDSLVAPIALYPDPILSQVLVASTYPLEVVEAGRWLKQHPGLKDKALVDAAAKQPWDASVQGLVVLPDVLKRLDQNVGWTSNLGNAFLAQQQGVMDAVQRLRKKASAAGALQSTPQQTVSTATEGNQTYIEIQPASTQVVYVPQYNPAAVWGPAPAYEPYPSMYYPPVSTGAVVAASALSFGAGMAIGAIWGGGGGWGGGWGWGVGWGGGGNVIVNNNFINRNNFNRANVGNGNRWVHNPAHRGGVPYNNRNLSNRYNGGARPATRPTVGQTQQRLGQHGGAAGMRPGGVGGGPNQGTASRLGPGNGGRGAGANARPGMNRPGQAGGFRSPGQGNANRMANPGGMHFGRNPGAGGMGNRGFANRGMGNGGFHGGGGFRGGGGFHRGGGGGFRGGGGGFRGGGGGGRRGGGGGRRR
jgi:hypothetical protein